MERDRENRVNLFGKWLVAAENLGGEPEDREGRGQSPSVRLGAGRGRRWKRRPVSVRRAAGGKTWSLDGIQGTWGRVAGSSGAVEFAELLR